MNVSRNPFASQGLGLAGDIRRAAVWNACTTIPGQDPTVWRYCANYRVIRWGDYGDRSSEYGWEIDHIIPGALGGGDAWSISAPFIGATTPPTAACSGTP